MLILIYVAYEEVQKTSGLSTSQDIPSVFGILPIRTEYLLNVMC